MAYCVFVSLRLHLSVLAHQYLTVDIWTPEGIRMGPDALHEQGTHCPAPPPQIAVCPTVSLAMNICSLPWLSYGIIIFGPYVIASIVWTEHRFVSPDGYCLLLIFWVVWYLYVPNGMYA